GLVGWPLMSATISAEGTDSWEAALRSYNYVWQRPRHYLGYSLVAICYGAVLVFFIGFMGSLTVFLAKWGVAQVPWAKAANRDPSYLFIYAPTSFGWRDLLLQGAEVKIGEGDAVSVVQGGHVNPTAYAAYVGQNDLYWWNKIGAGLVGFWLGLGF